MVQPGRNYEAGTSYRYGFNGKENDNEVKGEGNQQDYGMRIYDPRLGRFLSVDPLIGKYPMLTSYQFASNRPLDGTDIDGMEFLSSNECYINIYFRYDSKLKKITSGFANFRKDNDDYRPADLDAALEVNKKENTIGANAVVGSFKISFEPEFTKTQNTAEAEDIDNDRSVKGFNMPNVPQTKKEASEQQKNKDFYAAVSFDDSKLAKLGAAIELTRIVLTWRKAKFLESYINSSVFQTNYLKTITPILQYGIDKGIIPPKNLNDADISKIGNYLLYGAGIKKFDDKTNNIIVDEDLTAVAKNLWSIFKSYQDRLDTEEGEKKIEAHNRGPIDNTSVKKN